jgi:biotin operon repressor
MENPRVIRACTWYWADRAFLAQHAVKVGIIATGIYHALCYFANDDTGDSYPSHETIAKLLGISKSSVIRGLKALQRSGLIGVQERPNNSNIYILRSIQETLPSVIETSPSVCETPPGVSVGHMNNHNINNHYLTNKRTSVNTKNNSELPPECSFAAAYALYPRKLGRANAENHFNAQVKTKEDYDNLILAIKNYAADCVSRETEEQYIKHASTFFNKNWLDWVGIKPVIKQEVKRYQEL